MNKKSVMTICVFVGMLIVFTIASVLNNKKEPVVIQEFGLMPEMTIDDLIRESDLIVIGTVETILPSKWTTPNGKISRDLTRKEILDANLSIITDSLIEIDHVLKGAYSEKMVRVRSFFGEVDHYRYEIDSEEKYDVGKSYLLFLIKAFGRNQIIDPGGYMSVNSVYGVYEIYGDMAVTRGDEWLLGELIAYIEQSLSGDVMTETPLPADILTVTP